MHVFLADGIHPIAKMLVYTKEEVGRTMMPAAAIVDTLFVRFNQTQFDVWLLVLSLSYLTHLFSSQNQKHHLYHQANTAIRQDR